MIKFFKVKGTEIRKVAEVNGETVIKVVAILGKVSELLENEIIFSDGTFGNENKCLVIRSDDITDISEFESIEEAKDYCKNKFSE